MLTHHPTDLAEQIKRLEADRKRHARAMAEIDEVLARIHDALSALSSGPLSVAFRPSGNRITPFFGEIPQEKRRRGRFNQTAIDSVLHFIRDRGNPSTAEINSHWREEGRKGTVNVTLLKLLKERRILRQSDASVRGSRYVLTETAFERVERQVASAVPA
ncbi:MAG TPA: hypothetical protein VH475_15925 [Tepidisphaeraceae bacterium]